MRAALPILPSESAPPAGAPAPGAARPALVLDPRTYDRALACVHCGLCLPACPTYTQTGHEADSPRGRIQLIRALAEGTIKPAASVRDHLDLCLDCRACETACPSGVVYHELIEETRAKLPPRRNVKPEEKLIRWVFHHVLTDARRMRRTLLPVRILQRLGIYAKLRRTRLFDLLPPQFRAMERMLPASGPLWPRPLPARTQASPGGMDAILTALHDQAAGANHKSKATVGFFAGCVGSVMFDDVNRKAVHLLAAAGAEVLAPPAQGCCGAIHHHGGLPHPAEAMARRNIDAFLPRNGPAVDFVVTSVAGCGAMLREYDVLLRDDPAYADRAKRFVARVRDVTEVLDLLGLPAMKHAVKRVATYHDACHLAHAQRVTAAPRSLLAKVPGLTLVPLSESDTCCGAAGTYNLTQPAMAADLADRKLKNVAATGAAICIAGNAGCALHIQARANEQGRAIRVVHPVEILHDAVFGPNGNGKRDN